MPPSPPSTEENALERLFALAERGDALALESDPEMRAAAKRADGGGIRAMHVAAKAGMTDFVEYLVDTELDTGVNKPDADLRTPLHWACWFAHPDTAKSLLEMGASVNQPSRAGFTPLHYACVAGDLPTVKLLVEFGNANLEAKDEIQQTPLDVAIRFKHHDVVKYLKEEAPAIVRSKKSKRDDSSSGGVAASAFAAMATTTTQQDEEEAREALMQEEEEYVHVKNLERVVEKAVSFENDSSSSLEKKARRSKATVSSPPSSSLDGEEETKPTLRRSNGDVLLLVLGISSAVAIGASIGYALAARAEGGWHGFSPASRRRDA